MHKINSVIGYFVYFVLLKWMTVHNTQVNFQLWRFNAATTSDWKCHTFHKTTLGCIRCAHIFQYWKSRTNSVTRRYLLNKFSIFICVFRQHFVFVFGIKRMFDFYEIGIGWMDLIALTWVNGLTSAVPFQRRVIALKWMWHWLCMLADFKSMTFRSSTDKCK